MSKKKSRAEQKRTYRKAQKKLKRVKVNQIKAKRKANDRDNRIFKKVTAPAQEYISVKELKKAYKIWSDKRDPKYKPELNTLSQKERDYLRFMNSDVMIGHGNTLANNLISIIKTGGALPAILNIMKEYTQEEWNETTLRDYAIDGGVGFIGDGEAYINIPGKNYNITITWDRVLYNNSGSGINFEVNGGHRSYVSHGKSKA